jgi:hypothetical protein
MSQPIHTPGPVQYRESGAGAAIETLNQGIGYTTNKWVGRPEAVSNARLLAAAMLAGILNTHGGAILGTPVMALDWAALNAEARSARGVTLIPVAPAC